MTEAKHQVREVETKALSEAALDEVNGGIIAVLQPKAQMGDGSVQPAPQNFGILIGLLKP